MFILAYLIIFNKILEKSFINWKFCMLGIVLGTTLASVVVKVYLQIKFVE